MYEKIRHPETNRMTSVLNGTRFMYIDPLPEGHHLPRSKIEVPKLYLRWPKMPNFPLRTTEV